MNNTDDEDHEDEWDATVRNFDESQVILRLVQEPTQPISSSSSSSSSVSSPAPAPAAAATTSTLSVDDAVEQLIALTQEAAEPPQSPILGKLPNHVWRVGCAMALAARTTESVEKQRRLVEFAFRMAAVEVWTKPEGDDCDDGDDCKDGEAAASKLVRGGDDDGVFWSSTPFLSYNFHDNLHQTMPTQQPRLEMNPNVIQGRVHPNVDRQRREWENQSLFLGLYNNELFARHHQARHHQARHHHHHHQNEADLPSQAPPVINPAYPARLCGASSIHRLPHPYSYFLHRHLTALSAAFEEPWKPRSAASNAAGNPNSTPEEGQTGCAIRAACLFTIYGGVALWENTEMARNDDDDSGDDSDGDEETDYGGGVVLDSRALVDPAQWARWKQEFRIARVTYAGEEAERTRELVERALDEMDRLDGGLGS